MVGSQSWQGSIESGTRMEPVSKGVLGEQRRGYPDVLPVRLGMMMGATEPSDLWLCRYVVGQDTLEEQSKALQTRMNTTRTDVPSIFSCR